ncbi:spermidine synthase [Labeo rohita]|uniref:Spermidine synthase n=1 Tax=Labeo rohita TaxID=84645 RepID=A0A498LY23_LABRO|nr:spermidine synthase [Labeo rohita]
MDNIKDGWFTETCTLWPGQAMSLQVEEVLYHKKSKFQDVMVFKSKTYGNVLVLDGVIQCTERDEFSYQEMIANLPLCCHPCPKKVLIIGGGDGGVLREVVKHPLVESVVQCEIDEDVINVSKKYLPGMAKGFFSPKLTLHVGDGFEFMKKNQDAFDVIITDSSDPVGPAESLFKESYYQLMKTALCEGGILCCQGECQWLHLELIKEMRTFCKTLFPVVDYAYCTIPTYPSGQIGFMLCSKNPKTNFREPERELPRDEIESMNLKYYNPEIHRAAFILPEFARKELSKERKELILKLISGLLDGVDNSVLAGEIAPVPLDVEEPLESRLEERAVYNRLSQLPQRDRKAPCKNFFWKTFTSC